MNNLSDLMKEYRPSMDKEVLHSWAQDVTVTAPNLANIADVLVEAKSGLAAYTGGVDGACSETIKRIDAILIAVCGEVK